MNICFFGSYEPDYARNKILIDGLQKNHVHVLHCRSMSGSMLVRYPDLIRRFVPIKDKVDVIYVAFVGHLNVPLAWILGKLFGKRVVFDMFYSMYDTYVFDRKSTTPGSLRAQTYIWIDKLAANLADIVITDTQAHADYFVRLFGLPKEKFRRIFVGGDETIFKPKKKPPHKKIRIIFHGMFTRLHGAEYFVEAAKLLEKDEKLEFILIGSSQNYPLPITLYEKLNPQNLIYYQEMSIGKLVTLLAKCDISVGHLGNTIKAKSVITNKMFQALACKVMVVAGDCVANRELFRDRDTAWFVKMGSSGDLVEALLYLSTHQQIIKKIGDNGYRFFLKHLTNKQIGKRLVRVLREFV